MENHSSTAFFNNNTLTVVVFVEFYVAIKKSLTAREGKYKYQFYARIPIVRATAKTKVRQYFSR